MGVICSNALTVVFVSFNIRWFGGFLRVTLQAHTTQTTRRTKIQKNNALQMNSTWAQVTKNDGEDHHSRNVVDGNQRSEIDLFVAWTFEFSWKDGSYYLRTINDRFRDGQCSHTSQLRSTRVQNRYEWISKWPSAWCLWRQWTDALRET